MRYECSRLCLFLFAASLAIAGVDPFVEATLVVGQAPTALCYDSTNHKVFVANNISNDVSVIDANTNTVTATIPVGEKPVAICWNPTSGKIYVACAPYAATGSVHIIDAYTNAVIGSVDVGTNPIALAWNSTRNKIYCMNTETGDITVIDGASNELVASVRLPDQIPNDIAYNPVNDQIYVSSDVYNKTGKVRAIDCSVDTIVKSISTGQESCWDLDVNPTDNRVYCANRSSNTISVITCSDNRRIGNVAVQGEPRSALWIPGNKVFFSEYWTNSISFMRGDSLRIAGRFPIGGSPASMIYVPNTQKLFCTNYLTSGVSAIDARDGNEHMLLGIQVGAGPLGMALFPDRNRIYVGNSWDSTVSVIMDDVGVAEPIQAPGLATPPTLRILPSPAVAGSPVRFLASGLKALTLEIRDVGGRLVHSASGGSAGVWSASAAGVYFCTTSDGTRFASGKLTVR
jgi:YVTN family beta-propeller protein